jgi:hypothetical protein
MILPQLKSNCNRAWGREEKSLYKAVTAEEEAKLLLSESRSGICVS